MPLPGQPGPGQPGPGQPGPGHPVRVLVVEDSAVIRRLLAHIITSDPRLVLAGAVESAEEALEAIPRLRPDVISMDVRLPGMDGLEATRRIMAQYPTPIVVIADSVEDASLKISMNALRSGALAVVEKPPGLLSGDFAAISRTIATQLAIMSDVPVIRRRRDMFGETMPPSNAGRWRPAASAERRPDDDMPLVLAVAASTGGPPALARLLGALPASFPLPVLVVQHMGAPFLEGFAGWLDGLVPMRVTLAQDQEQLQPGHVLVAPGGRHLAIAPAPRDRDATAGARLQVRLGNAPAVSGQLPSATVTFRSVAETVGARALGVLLTGMGEDGAAGLVAMKQAGGYTITEHESSAVVYGMPAAGVRLGGSCSSVPLDEIAQHILGLLQDRDPRRPGGA
ncbi:chemotaxis-specific protein-glutamate methyltransferase CheB [Lichenicola sp.]|uniref:chemotaxis-specific protein-glutamate methyltransferase CheB n=1 Tax=Lichenicola sp. TaxID=2804529 RepID=UPI003B007A80